MKKERVRVDDHVSVVLHIGRAVNVVSIKRADNAAFEHRQLERLIYAALLRELWTTYFWTI